MPTDSFSFVLCQINAVVGDVTGNARRILAAAKAQSKDSLCVFPELCLTGYSPDDLVYSPAFRRAVEAEVQKLAAALKNGPAIIIGAPVWEPSESCDPALRWRWRVKPYNAALFIADDVVQGAVYKSDLPNYDVFDDRRLFRPGPLPEPIAYKGRAFGVMVCEDIWTPEASAHLKARGAENLIVINASPYERGKHTRRIDNCALRVAETGLPLVYVNLVGGQDDVLYDGQSFLMDGQGKIAMRLSAFEENCARSGRAAKVEEAEEIYKGLVCATRDYVHKNDMKGVFIGLSGGVDSALVAAIAVDALGPKNVRVVTMPTRFNSNESLDDAQSVAEMLGLHMEMQPIENALDILERQLKIKGGLAHENIQSRLRGVTLMALSNAKPGWLVLSTTNKSELAVGYGTLYGDMVGAFAPIKDLYKRDVYALSKWRGLPERVLVKAPSAELHENQKDQDTLPPYDVLDTILSQLIEDDRDPSDIKGDQETVAKIARWVRQSEFKRRQGPPGPKIGAKAFGRDRRYPVTNAFQET